MNVKEIQSTMDTMNEELRSLRGRLETAVDSLINRDSPPKVQNPTGAGEIARSSVHGIWMNRELEVMNSLLGDIRADINRLETFTGTGAQAASQAATLQTRSY